MLEREEKKKQLEHEEKKKQLEHEDKQKQLEHEEKKKQLEHEEKKKELELQEKKQATPLESQDIDSFVTRVKMLFDAWIELDGCEAKTFDQLRDLMIREQLYRSLDDDLVVFIRERTPKNIEELISIVHTYVGAHPDKTLGKRFNVGNVAYNKGATTTNTHVGRYTSCTMFDGSARKFPIAKINVSTPFITGVIEALVIEHPITDLIIGN
ncbi:hypothetical protein EGW08_014089, partial [Elysia chlorotica]